MCVVFYKPVRVYDSWTEVCLAGESWYFDDRWKEAWSQGLRHLISLSQILAFGFPDLDFAKGPIVTF